MISPLRVMSKSHRLVLRAETADPDRPLTVGVVTPAGHRRDRRAGRQHAGEADRRPPPQASPSGFHDTPPRRSTSPSVQPSPSAAVKPGLTFGGENATNRGFGAPKNGVHSAVSSMSDDEQVKMDAIVVGGGPAGLSAAFHVEGSAPAGPAAGSAARRRSSRSRCGTTVYFGSSAEAIPASKTPNRVQAEPASSGAPADAPPRPGCGRPSSAARPPRRRSAPRRRRSSGRTVPGPVGLGDQPMPLRSAGSAASSAAAPSTASPPDRAGSRPAGRTTRPSPAAAAVAEPANTNGSSR